ncbi:MAG: Dam family site-specific DNA-(adenine-N6)-methyltransferase [Deltaproteobacteria bacterium]|nr:Dam family site-specific DNA-(adenine-N6)-methyltransferase [Deltaproteobacteria bacterium]
MVQSNKTKYWSRPFIRWAGSKRKLLPYLIYEIPKDFDRYIEPFAGSSCLFFSIKPSNAILSDINEELMQTYEILLRHPRLLAKKVHSLDCSKDSYYKIRAMDPNQLSRLDKAVRFIFLNRYCFNGIYRTNKKGKFNVPHGTRTGGLPSEAEFYRCSYALRQARLKACDFEKSLTNISKGDFFYLDPPYVTSKKQLKGEYGPICFNINDINRLFDMLHRIDQNKGRFLLSYIKSEEIEQKIPLKWKVKTVNVNRHISGFSKHRATVEEILVKNY